MASPLLMSFLAGDGVWAIGVTILGGVLREEAFTETEGVSDFGTLLPFVAPLAAWNRLC